jgi:leader peptidase (prepilin peptidase)/N-methyltransferase
MTWLEISSGVGKVGACLGFFIIGMIVFSFLNVIIYRLPEKKKLSKPICPKCQHELKIADTIPVISYITLKGKCRYCGERIAVRQTLIEIMGGLFAVILTGYFGMNLKALTLFLFFSILTVITFIDIDTMEIPPVLNAAILVLGIISIFTIGEVSLLERIIGMFCVSLPLFLIILVIPDGFGGGDIKLMFAAGFFLGWKCTVVGFFIGLIMGGAYGVVCLIRRNLGKKDHFAFGPFLSVGLAAAVFCGNPLMNMYIDFLNTALHPY